jgi:predicted ATP-grasp superfamily ATP-dependent carboligase
MFADEPAFVLTMGAYYGSLAAVRCLGQAGLPVVVADGTAFAAASWSRYVVRRHRSPPVRPLAPFVDWLIELGRRSPGRVLYATSDDLAWTFAERGDELRRHYRLLTPPFETLRRLLDKRELYTLCATAGIPVPRTWFPRDESDLEVAAREASRPLLIKPRTQVLFTSRRKGRIVGVLSELKSAYADFLRYNRYEDRFLREHPDVERPMLQECGSADEPIYSISGFCDAPNGLFTVRASTKLVQWPRLAGVGLYFEDAPVREDLAEKIRRMCEGVGFVGVFEAEFIGGPAGLELIDFNPRFFGQMGFDVARGLPSPLLVYLAAIGDTPRLRAEVDAAVAWRPRGPMRYANRTALALTRTAERLVGRKPTEVTRARGGNGAGRTMDAVGDSHDWLPVLVDGVQQVGSALRHPRAMLKAALRRD